MWIDANGNQVTGQYTAPNGTTYPASFPRNEIPGLTEVPDPVVPVVVPTASEIVRAQIFQLEESITNRMWREDATGQYTAVMDFGPGDNRTGKTATQYIAFVNDAIAVLRASL